MGTPGTSAERPRGRRLDFGGSRVRAVIDTNVVAYHLFGAQEFALEAQDFLQRAEDLAAPAVWEAELANVVWMSVRGGVLAEAEAPTKLSLAARLGIHTVAVRTLWHGALLRSIQSGVPVYDTLFVELADREQVPLITFDRKLTLAYPSLARRPKDFVA